MKTQINIVLMLLIALSVNGQYKLDTIALLKAKNTELQALMHKRDSVARWRITDLKLRLDDLDAAAYSCEEELAWTREQLDTCENGVRAAQQYQIQLLQEIKGALGNVTYNKRRLNFGINLHASKNFSIEAGVYVHRMFINAGIILNTNQTFYVLGGQRITPDIDVYIGPTFNQGSLKNISWTVGLQFAVIDAAGITIAADTQSGGKLGFIYYH